MIEVQQKRIDDLRRAQAKALQGGGATALTVSNMTALILDREAARLKDLQAGPDPIIQALLRMAECYIGLKEPDEARTILHRLRGATLPPDQQQELDLQLLLTYTLGGQAALDDYLKKHPGDPNADSISVQIGQALMKRQPPDYQGALNQALRSLKDFRNGKAVGQAITLEAAALEKLGKVKESQSVTDNYLKAHPDSPLVWAMLLTKGQGQMSSGDLKDAVATFSNISISPKSGVYAAAADAQLIQA
jgi:outer membrane protein assembly factor BamD (BamD/ComL family)